jgi:hypothetical protein
MRDVLTGSAVSVTDFGRVRAGDRVAIVLDGWQAERLIVTVTEIKLPLDHSTGLTWLYGIDGIGRVRLVLARCAPPAVIGRATVNQTRTHGLAPHRPPADRAGTAQREEKW